MHRGRRPSACLPVLTKFGQNRTATMITNAMLGKCKLHQIDKARIPVLRSGSRSFVL